VPDRHRGLRRHTIGRASSHTVRLMPPAYVKPYVKRHKNDASAVTSPEPSLAPVRSKCVYLDER
jgi:hypothetical protein